MKIAAHFRLEGEIDKYLALYRNLSRARRLAPIDLKT